MAAERDIRPFCLVTRVSATETFVTLDAEMATRRWALISVQNLDTPTVGGLEFSRKATRNTLEVRAIDISSTDTDVPVVTQNNAVNSALKHAGQVTNTRHAKFVKKKDTLTVGEPVV
jgi:hypothetical protein